ncbi:putative membrane protein [Rhizobium mongolense]|uniref:Membrane protein n=1 Tax=Rhizobium mongolense TaxID=57676 RepID=A0ABR6IM66_9HYPH|nr:putative membrane protein [Rhizobium mongolense]
MPTIIGWPLCEGWIALSLILYVVTGLFWLPVVWIQVRLRDLARAAATAGEQLPAEYFRLYHIWFVCGFPAFLAVIGTLWLMVSKPSITLF